MIMMLITSTIMFMFNNHPMTMGMNLMIQTLLISLCTGMMTSFWFSYIIFLIMIGGMMILFIYMTSISSSMKFKLSMTNIIMTVIMMTMMMLMNNLDIIENKMKSTINYKIDFTMTMSKFLTMPSMTLYMMMVMYLFITLIAMVKISSSINGPLRKS
uniref:NADH-ubiquinone oxidoreductase chain 6 n=1 Tax=Coleoptera sp. 30 KM-2017 TaxID=2219335 RepID=A0A346RKD2_9COLE|nr:NADH dehydrogenase subunit 6 [Coleoptera sp. 30 KM-2017]